MEYSTDPVYWKNQHGKYVVLVSSDNPWYENTDTTEIMPVLKPEHRSQDLSANGYKSFATVPRSDHKVQISTTQPDDGVEYFTSRNKKHKSDYITSEHKIYDIIICIIILLILFQIIFLYI